MSMKQIITGILRVEASGEFSLEDAKKAFIEMLKVAVYHKSGKILFDDMMESPTTSTYSCMGNSSRKQPRS